MTAVAGDWQPLPRSRSNTWPTLPRPLEELNKEKLAGTGTGSAPAPDPEEPPPPLPPAARRSSRCKPWGDRSYAELIEQAISSAPDGRLTLAQIYEWLSVHVPYFGERSEGARAAAWKNSVRHNLSLCPRFTRQRNEGSSPAGSGWWTLDLSAPPGRSGRRQRSGSLDVRVRPGPRCSRGGRRASKAVRQQEDLPEEWQPYRSTLREAGHRLLDPLIEAGAEPPPSSSCWSSVPSPVPQAPSSWGYFHRQDLGDPSQYLRGLSGDYDTANPTLQQHETSFRPRSSSTTSVSYLARRQSPFGDGMCQPYVTYGMTRQAPVSYSTAGPTQYYSQCNSSSGTGAGGYSPQTIAAASDPFDADIHFRPRSASTSTNSSYESSRLTPVSAAPAAAEAVWQPTQSTYWHGSASCWLGASSAAQPAGSLEEFRDLRLDAHGRGDIVTAELTLEDVLDFDSTQYDTLPTPQPWCPLNELNGCSQQWHTPWP